MSHPLDVAVAKRHSDIPQDELPLDFPAATSTKGSEIRTRPAKSVRWAKCPHHTPSGKQQLTGVVLDSDGVGVFREHTKRVGNQSLPCPGSGQSAPETSGEVQ